MCGHTVVLVPQLTDREEISLSHFLREATSGVLSVNGHNTCGDGNPGTLNVTLTTLPLEAGTVTGVPAGLPGLSRSSVHIDSVPHATSYLWEFTGSNVNISGGSQRYNHRFWP